MKVKVLITLSDGASNFRDATTPALSLHEALCRAIHEGNEAAEEWLNDFVLDIMFLGKEDDNDGKTQEDGQTEGS